MSYMRDLEHKLRELLEEGDAEKVVKFVKESVVESYRNGQKAPKAPHRKERNQQAKADYQR